MDFRRLSKVAESTSNGTNPVSLTELPSNILEALIPGYGPISRYILSTLGVDISIFVSIALILVAGSRGGQYLFNWAESIFRRLLLSSVYIDDDDDLFDMAMEWLAEKQSSASRRSVRAKTQRGSKTGGVLDDSVGDALDESGLFNYNKWNARTPPRFEPHYGRHYFWHGGKLFFFQRSQRSANTTRLQISWGSGSADEDIIQLDCIGWSTKPVQELLRSIKIWSLDRLRNTTTIRHPTPRDRGKWGGAWSKTSSRPSRPMETVILDAKQKTDIIRDVNEYLHPASPRWYATRGIPYRRGYLFHGPPGTGKTSLSFALAGIFGLEIFAISLQEPTLTENDLMQLFSGLPSRCIVLLEDVDAAGLLRDGKSGSEDKTKRKGKAGKDEKEKDGEKEVKGQKGVAKKDEEYTLQDTLKDLAKELKAVNAQKGGNKGGNDNNASGGGHPNRAPGTGVSLSGLLNAIDGVASHEGRVLVMTTNHPEQLDAALVRPGRVDLRVEFKLAMKEQISELFVRMYAASDVPKFDIAPDRATTGYEPAWKVKLPVLEVATPRR
jgi:chaperone BCS1